MAYVIDTNIFIAIARPEDSLNVRAKEIINEIKTTGERRVITDHILDEVVTYLNKKSNCEAAVKMSKLMAATCEIVFHDSREVPKVLEIVEKYRVLSYCDALSIVKMKQLEIAKIASFDAGFDKVKGIKRTK